MFQVLTYFQVKKSFGGPATCDEASTPEGKDHVSGSYLLPGQEELRRPGHVRRGIDARGQGPCFRFLPTSRSRRASAARPRATRHRSPRARTGCAAPAPLRAIPTSGRRIRRLVLLSTRTSSASAPRGTAPTTQLKRAP